MVLTDDEVRSIIQKVPEAERRMPALVVDNKVYTWNEVMHLIDKGSPTIKRKVYEKIESMRARA